MCPELQAKCPRAHPVRGSQIVWGQEVSKEAFESGEGQAIWRRSRRAAVGQLLAAAGLAALRLRTAGADVPSQPDDDKAPLADLGMELDAAQRAAGVAFLARHPTVDVHAHPGLFLLGPPRYRTSSQRSLGEPFVGRALADLHAGRVSAALFSCVADTKLLELSGETLRANREFQPGEAYADYKRQLATLQTLKDRHEVARGLNPADVRAAQRHGQTAAVFSVEGGDFIEDHLDRVGEAFRDGVRSIQLVHYHINQLGDIQSEAPVHNGLTPLGKAVVREMNSAGMLIDLAHATFAVTKDAVEVSTRPVMISHTNLVSPTVSHPRLISHEHAVLVAAAGGVIGSWPSGIGQRTFADYIDSIRRLADAVGIDHVAIGTDMHANYRPVFRNYRDWNLIPAALLARGLSEKDVAKIMGENFLRIFDAALAHTPGPRES
jgi:membrane dipeptidase